MTTPLGFHQRYRTEDRGYKTPCWIWQGAKWKNGYGVIHVPGTSSADGSSRNEGAHCYAYKLRYGSIPRGKRVLRKCDQPDCVNWDHLYAGTQSRGGQHLNVGAANAGAKIGPDEVAKIRELRGRGVSEREVAKQFGISHTHVGRIYRGERWKAAS